MNKASNFSQAQNNKHWSKIHGRERKRDWEKEKNCSKLKWFVHSSGKYEYTREIFISQIKVAQNAAFDIRCSICCILWRSAKYQQQKKNARVREKYGQSGKQGLNILIKHFLQIRFAFLWPFWVPDEEEFKYVLNENCTATFLMEFPDWWWKW